MNKPARPSNRVYITGGNWTGFHAEIIDDFGSHATVRVPYAIINLPDSMFTRLSR